MALLGHLIAVRYILRILQRENALEKKHCFHYDTMLII